MSEQKDLWQSGFDLVAAQDDEEDAELIVQGAIQAFSAGFDIFDPDEREDLMLSLLNETAWVLTFPQPTDADPDPLGTPDKEEAFGRRMHSLAEHLAQAYAEWIRHDSGECQDCGGGTPPKPPSKAN